MSSAVPAGIVSGTKPDILRLSAQRSVEAPNWQTMTTTIPHPALALLQQQGARLPKSGPRWGLFRWRRAIAGCSTQMTQWGTKETWILSPTTRNGLEPKRAATWGSQGTWLAEPSPISRLSVLVHPASGFECDWPRLSVQMCGLTIWHRAANEMRCSAKSHSSPVAVQPLRSARQDGVWVDLFPQPLSWFAGRFDLSGIPLRDGRVA